MNRGAYDYSTILVQARRRRGLWLTLLIGFGLLGASTARAAEGLRITFTTSVTGENYSPKNVHVAWVENGNGTFQKTIGRWAKSQRSQLIKWYSASGESESSTTVGVDGYTAATQSNSGTYTATWNLIPKGGSSTVPDGIYTIKLELTCSNGGDPENYAVFTFNKNGRDSTQYPPNQNGYSNITITYTGRPALPPDITLSASSLGFAQVIAGTTKDLTFNINNPGGSDLVVGAIGLAGADQAAYSLVSPPVMPLIIAAGGQQTITARFAPGARRTYNNASLNVASNTPGKPTVPVALSGKGIAPVMRVVTQTLNFPETVVGGQATQSFTVNNPGDSPLHVAALNPVGMGKGAFSITAPAALPVTVAPAGSQLVTVRFAPTSDMLYQHARLAIGGDDPALRVTTVSLNGLGMRVPLGGMPPERPVAGPSNAIVMLNATTAVVGRGALLTLYDVSSPAPPAVVGQVRLGGDIRNLVVSATTVYAAMGATGVSAVSVADFTHPSVTAKLDTPGYAYDLALAGQTLCVADGLGGLKTFNIANPQAPVAGATFATEGPARAVATHGTTAYVLDSNTGLQIVSLASPLNPKKLGALNDEFGTSIAYANQKVYLTTRLKKFHVIDVANPAAPKLTANRLISGPGNAMTIAGNIAYIANGAVGLERYDLTTTPPTYLGVDTIQGEVRDIAIQGTTALVAAGPGGFQILNIQTPRKPVMLGSDALAAAGGSVGDAGLTAAMGDSGGGLEVVNLASPFMARLRGVVKAIGEVRAVAINGSVAYVAAGPAGLRIVNIANPDVPSVVGTFPTQGYANSVAVSGSTVLVADGLKVYRVNAANPVAPTQAGVWSSSGYAFGVAIDGRTAYVANGGMGLSTFDLGGGKLTLLGGSPTAGVAYGVAVSNGYACVAAGDAGLQVFDVKAPSAPALLATFDAGGLAMSVALRWPYAYLANGAAGMEIINLNKPASPLLQAKSSTPLRAYSVAAGPDRVIVGDSLGGPIYFIMSNAAEAWKLYE